MLALLSSFPESKESPWFFAGRDLLLLFCLFFYFFFFKAATSANHQATPASPFAFSCLACWK